MDRNITEADKKKKKKANTGELISDMAKSFGTSDDAKGKTLNLFKGLIFSDDKKAKDFMKKLDKATTEIAKEMKDGKKKKEGSTMKTTKSYFIEGQVIPAGSEIEIEEEKKFNEGISIKESENYGKAIVLKKVKKGKRFDFISIGQEVQGIIDDFDKTSSGYRVKATDLVNLDTGQEHNYGVFYTGENGDYEIVSIDGEMLEGSWN